MCKPKKRLHSCNSEKLNICGTYPVALTGRKEFAVQDIYVVKDLHQPPLGGPALEALDLIEKKTALIQSIVKRKLTQSAKKGIVRCSKA